MIKKKKKSMYAKRRKNATLSRIKVKLVVLPRKKETLSSQITKKVCVLVFVLNTSNDVLAEWCGMGEEKIDRENVRANKYSFREASYEKFGKRISF